MKQRMSSIRLLPCGHSIGLNLLQKDFTVVDLFPVLKTNGLFYYPAREAGIRVNDVILEVEGRVIKTELAMCQMINEAAKTKEFLEVTLRRHDKIIYKTIKPFYYSKTKSYKIGIMLKALTTGIGTLTFYDPVSKIFAALGHAVANLPEGPLSDNTIVPSTISSIIKGKSQKPGRKVGYLNESNEFKGRITQNCLSGIFGILQGKVNNPYVLEPISVIPKEKVRQEKGYIYTVVEGEMIEKFDIFIDEVKVYDDTNKDITISIKDSNLVKRTGGVVLGMSGSPIIQDEQIIGAISNVSFNDSLKGYAVSIENMLRQM